MAKQKLSSLGLRLKKMAVCAMAKFATKDELTDAVLHPVDISSLTPSSTFVKNAVIGINGVLYRATAATSNLPCALVTQDGALVTHTVNGKTAYVVSDATPNAGWEIFTDASIEYWVEALNASLSSKQDTVSDIATIRSNAANAVKPTDVYTYNGQDYTVSELLQALAELMPKTVVTQ